MPFTTLDLSKQSGTSLPSSIVTASGLTTGKVLQVLSASTTSKRSTSSTSFADISGLSVAITPSATSSKILCMCTIKGVASDNSTSDAISFKIVRDSTQISIATNMTFGNADQMNMTYPVVVLDSPSSTSELTYKAQFASRQTNSSSINNTSPNDQSEIVVMEIAA